MLLLNATKSMDRSETQKNVLHLNNIAGKAAYKTVNRWTMTVTRRCINSAADLRETGEKKGGEEKKSRLRKV